VSKNDQLSKIDKREAILQAALELIAANGFQQTPMSLISKRSGASAGVIYHYFESKDELVRTIYYRIKAGMNQAILAADDPGQPLARRFQSLWLSIYRYCIDHPQEMTFLEQYESLPGAKVGLEEKAKTLYDLVDELNVQHVLDSMSQEEKALVGLISDLRSQDLLKDLPLEVVSEFTLGVALRLARQTMTGAVTLDETTLATTARACWDAIAR
jgi:TetR/AcrR family transcriptional regulator, repressor of fatR-cypB operon